MTPAPERDRLLCIAGFGDDASMFAPLLETSLTDVVDIQPISLPGFGAPPLSGQKTTLAALADYVDKQARERGARFILAHSVASIIASLAAQREGSPIELIVSLEGNLTAEDAYFSGTAADFEEPEAFRQAFLARLYTMASREPVIARYRQIVTDADPLALWELGCDAHAFSSACVPGDVLLSAAEVVYLYNPDNVPESSLEWLEANPIKAITMPQASHWPSIDQPEALATSITQALRGVYR
ncbi:MAG: alpha/beta hydrolase [Pseudomonadota bacterium]